jgi:hypothetical protein
MSDIKFDTKNYRVHNDKNKKIIRKSLEDCGAGRSVLVDKDNILIAGNGVYEQAQEMGLKVRVVESDGSELVVVKRTDLSTDDEKRKLLALADNYASDTSEFNLDLVLQDFSPDELDLWEFAVSLEEEITPPIPTDLISPKKDNLPFIKITFSDFKKLERFQNDMDELLEKYGYTSYVVGGGEL